MWVLRVCAQLRRSWTAPCFLLSALLLKTSPFLGVQCHVVTFFCSWVILLFKSCPVVPSVRRLWCAFLGKIHMLDKLLLGRSYSALGYEFHENESTKYCTEVHKTRLCTDQLWSEAHRNLPCVSPRSVVQCSLAQCYSGFTGIIVNNQTRLCIHSWVHT